MLKRWRLGPVFTFEALTGMRRRRVYAGRALFVLLLLGMLTLIWGPEEQYFPGPQGPAVIGKQFFISFVMLQMAVVLLAAPAATASSICVDKSRGTLLHAFVTDLSNREIVFGKFAARVAPILALVACGVPMLAITTLLGGVDLREIVCAYAATAGVALVASSIALSLSVWARKPQHALLPTYGLLALWAGSYPLAAAAGGWAPAIPWTRGASSPFACLGNPFMAALAVTYNPDAVGLRHVALFFVIFAFTAVVPLIAVIGRLRPVVLHQAFRPARRERPGFAAKVLAHLPTPPLDANPVLWREWHRKKPTRWAGRLWTGYAGLCIVASLSLVVAFYVAPDNHNLPLCAAHVNAWEVTIGLLLLSISAAASLAEERDRGSLDVIMATPLSSREILWGKWWGTFAMIPRLAILPIWVIIALAMVGGWWLGPLLLIGLMLALSAMITSLGLALATWVPRLGRAISLCVVAYMVITLGFILVPLWIAEPLNRYCWTLGFQPPEWESAALGSPFMGVFWSTIDSARIWTGEFRYNDTGIDVPNWAGEPGGYLFWIVVFSAAAAVLMIATVKSFDLCLGRATGVARPGARELWRAIQRDSRLNRGRSEAPV